MAESNDPLSAIKRGPPAGQAQGRGVPKNEKVQAKPQAPAPPPPPPPKQVYVAPGRRVRISRTERVVIAGAGMIDLVRGDEVSEHTHGSAFVSALLKDDYAELVPVPPPAEDDPAPAITTVEDADDDTDEPIADA